MNKHKLARSHGFHHWNDLVNAAREARALRSELRAERARHAPLVSAAADVETARVALSMEREALARGWWALGELLLEATRTAERHAGACTLIAEDYFKRAEDLCPRINKEPE